MTNTLQLQCRKCGDALQWSPADSAWSSIDTAHASWSLMCEGATYDYDVPKPHVPSGLPTADVLERIGLDPSGRFETYTWVDVANVLHINGGTL